MASIQRFLGQDRNELRNAVVYSVSGVRSSNRIYRTASPDDGSGIVSLTGDYTGIADAAFDVEVSGGGSTPTVSMPVSTQVGNATMVIGDASGATAESYAVRLENLGIETTYARALVEEAIIVSREAGTPGNGITLSLDRSAITATATGDVTLADWASGTAYQTGEEWAALGAYPLLSDGTLHASTPRIRIGEDPQVFRPYVALEDGERRIYLDPAPPRDLPSGSAIYAISGGQTLTISKPSQPDEVTADLVTRYDLLRAIDASAYVEVDGAIGNDRRPGGQGVREISTRTAAYALPARVSGSSYLGAWLEQVSVGASASSQTVEIECIDNVIPGSERWSVRGSTALADAISGVLYTTPTIEFLIPQQRPTATPTGDVSFTVAYASRAGEEKEPPICVKNITLGRNAKAGTFTFTYRAAPSADCACDDLSPSGSLSAACLGLDVGDIDVSTLDSALKTRLVSLYGWLQTVIDANTSVRGNTVTGVSLDRQLFRQVAGEFERVLHQIWNNTTAAAHWDTEFALAQVELADFAGAAGGQVVWTATTEIAQYTRIMPTTGNDNGHWYTAITVSGSSQTGATEPTWPTNGTTVTDGDITWKDMGIRYAGAYGYPAVYNYQSAGAGSLLVSIDASAVGAVYAYYSFDGSTYTYGSHLYRYLGFSDGQNSGARLIENISETNSFPTDGSTFTTTTGAIFQDIGYWRPGTGAGDSGLDVSTTSDIAEFVARYTARLAAVLLDADIIPGKSEGTGAGAACWSPPTGGYYWDLPGYLPADTNRIYHSAKKDTDGEVYSTMEFALGIVLKCPEYLKVGDSVTVTIGDVTGTGATYQLGDTYEVPIIAASPVGLSGGQTGDDTHTWSVRGSTTGRHVDYAVVDGSEVAYSQSGVPEFTIYRGAFDAAIGDEFTFSVQSPRFRWRKDGGTYSSYADIPSIGTASLSDGLTAQFSSGSAPSWPTLGVWTFAAKQPYAPANAALSGDAAFEWGTGATADVIYDLGSSKSIITVGALWHELPVGAQLTISGGETTSADDWSVVIDRTLGPMVAHAPSPSTARYVKFALAGSASGILRWLWVGAPLSMTSSATEMRLSVTHTINVGAGVNPGGQYRGSGGGAQLVWDGTADGYLLPADIDAILAMVDAHAKAGNTPVALIPVNDEPAGALLTRLGQTTYEYADRLAFTSATSQIRSLSIQLDPVSLI